MARYVDIDKPLIIPVTDQQFGDIKYDKQITLGELFEGLIDGPELEVVDAIPVEWLKSKRKEALHEGMRPDEVEGVEMVLWMWQKEQEASK